MGLGGPTYVFAQLLRGGDLWWGRKIYVIGKTSLRYPISFVWWDDLTFHLYHRQTFYSSLCFVSSVVMPGTVVSVLTFVLSRGIYMIVEKAEFISILLIKASRTSSLLQRWEGISLSYHWVFLI